MGRSVHGDDDGAKTRRPGKRHGRAQCVGAQAPAASKAAGGSEWSPRCRDAAQRSARMSAIRRNDDARRRAWRARPGPGRACNAVPAGRDRTPWRRTGARRRGFRRTGSDRPSRLSAGEGREAEVMVAMTNPVFFPAASVARSAFWGADGEFRARVIKRRFQLSRSGYMVSTVFIRGERMENTGLRLPFGGRAATSAAANFHKSSRFQGSRWRANSSISCRV